MLLGPNPTFFTWEASDLNRDEVLRCDVYLSDDNGQNWVLHVSSVTGNQTAFDPAQTPLQAGTQWLLRVECTDGLFNVSDTSDTTFSVIKPGGIPPPPIELLIIAITAVIIIIVVLVIIIWLRKRTKV